MDFIIIAVILVAVVFALLHSRKHFAGGGCCGGGSTTIRDKKVLAEPRLGEKVFSVDGMHCENCEIRIENALNRLDGVLCKASWKKKTVTVTYSRDISDEIIKETVDKLGYTVM